MALLAGLGVAGTILYFMHKRHVRCSQFPDIYSENGPIHLLPEADHDVREFIAIKLDDAETANIDLPTEKLTKMAAQHVAPDCDWDWGNLETVKAQQIYASISTIVSYMKKQREQQNG